MEEDLDARRPDPFLNSFDAWLNARQLEAPVAAEELMQIFVDLLFRLRSQLTYDQLHQMVHLCVSANEAGIKDGSLSFFTPEGEPVPFMTKEERDANPEKADLIDQMLALMAGQSTIPDDISELA